MRVSARSWIQPRCGGLLRGGVFQGPDFVEAADCIPREMVYNSKSYCIHFPIDPEAGMIDPVSNLPLKNRVAALIRTEIAAGRLEAGRELTLRETAPIMDTLERRDEGAGQWADGPPYPPQHRKHPDASGVRDYFLQDRQAESTCRLLW